MSDASIDVRQQRQIWAAPATIAVVVVTVFVLRVQGRIWSCSCGEWNLWSGDVWSLHNSQHLIDPYSFTHVLHGVLFAGLLRWLRPGWSTSLKIVVSTAVECFWEIVENSRFVIDRYREATVSLDYYGDSIINSSATSRLACWFASRADRNLRSIAFVLVTELVLLSGFATIFCSTSSCCSSRWMPSRNGRWGIDRIYKRWHLRSDVRAGLS
jgi:hypothetical protein